jgi:alcohol dehydrogenase
MKALVYHGPGQKAWEEVPDASVKEPTDVVVRVDTTTICGTDLHILQGDVAAVTDGRILGHEAVGTVTEVGEAVKGFSVGDRVLVPAITKCGRCEYCQQGMPSHCQTVGGIGWIFGHLIDGTQAESVRVPYADTSLYAVPGHPDHRPVGRLEGYRHRLEQVPPGQGAGIRGDRRGRGGSHHGRRRDRAH